MCFWIDNGSHVTHCGLPGIREIPFGAHMCSFYRTGDELSAALVAYFAAGLRNNERGIWITAEPLPAARVLADLGSAGIGSDYALRHGSLVVRDYSDWYAGSKGLKGADVVDLWLAEERRALLEGYSGLRITGNVTFLQGQKDWDLFMEYETLLDEALYGSRIVTLCTYLRADAQKSRDVERRHTCTLDHPDDGWQVLTDRAA